jgi:hypothetical protein
MKRGGCSWLRTKRRAGKKREQQRLPVTVTVTARKFVDALDRKLRDMEPEGNA